MANTDYSSNRIDTDTTNFSGILDSGDTDVQKALESLDARAVGTITIDTTLDSTHSIVLCDASGGEVTITLPAASGATGRRYDIKKTDSSGYAVVVDGNGTETIDGSETKTITEQYTNMTIVSDGSKWHII